MATPPPDGIGSSKWGRVLKLITRLQEREAEIGQMIGVEEGLRKQLDDYGGQVRRVPGQPRLLQHLLPEVQERDGRGTPEEESSQSLGKHFGGRNHKGRFWVLLAYGGVASNELGGSRREGAAHPLRTEHFDVSWRSLVPEERIDMQWASASQEKVLAIHIHLLHQPATRQACRKTGQAKLLRFIVLRPVGAVHTKRLWLHNLELFRWLKFR